MQWSTSLVRPLTLRYLQFNRECEQVELILLHWHMCQKKDEHKVLWEQRDTGEKKLLGTVGLHKCGLESQTLYSHINYRWCDLEVISFLLQFHRNVHVEIKRINPGKWLKLCLIEYIPQKVSSSLYEYEWRWVIFHTCDMQMGF